MIVNFDTGKRFVLKLTKTNQDNGRPHTGRVTIDPTNIFKWDTVTNLSYSPDVVPSGYDLFPELKKKLDETYFKHGEGLKEEALSY
ncbi:hypothetical protein Trydic_g15781 [Trypoxylus dichotomus]